MKHILAAALCLAATAAAAEPVLGTWQTQPDDNGHFGHLEIAPCGAAVCGTITQAFNGDGSVRTSENIGRRILWDTESRRNGSYCGGKIWAPDRDKTYNSRMELQGDRLEVSGCILGICRGQTWLRVK